MRPSTFLIACLFSLVVTACQTTPPRVDHRAEFAAQMQPHIGKMTYARMVDYAGIPTRKDTMPDGGIVAEWTTSQSGLVVMPGMPGPLPMPAVAVPVSSGSTMRLTFDANSILQGGQLDEW